MANFITSLKPTLKNEDWYSNHHYDGETYCGITRKHFPKWDGWKLIDAQKDNIAVDFKNFKEVSKILKSLLYLNSLVESFYKNEFWDKMNLSFVASQDIANKVFDIGVNIGRFAIIKILQKACNEITGDYLLVTDGVVGSRTIESTNKCNSSALLIQLKEEIVDYYNNLPDSETKVINLAGWIKRANS